VSWRDPKAQRIISFASQLATLLALTRLALRGCQLQPCFPLALGNAARTTASLMALDLSMTTSSLWGDPDCARCLAIMLGALPQLTLLRLSDCEMSGNAATWLAEALQTAPLLCHLDLSDSTCAGEAF
jgi:hypothetical protein